MRKTLFLFALITVVTVALSACGGNGHHANGKTQLTMVVTDIQKGRAAFHLSCRPPRGDFHSPAKSCAAVEKNSTIVTDPKPLNCIGCLGSGFQVSFGGLIDGRPVQSQLFIPAWNGSMPLVRAGLYGAFVYTDFSKHLLPLRHVILNKPTVKTYPPGQLRPADLVSCNLAGSHIELPVPFIGAWDKMPRFEVAILKINRNKNGSVWVSCRKL